MPTKNLKYQTKIDEIPNCPPKAARERQIDAFRIVFEDIKQLNNFLPNSIRKPARANSGDDVKKCSGYALSFYTKDDSAENEYKKLINIFKNFAKNVGNHLASGRIIEEHGLCTDEDENNHFDLHEYEDCDLVPVFKIIKKL